MNPQKMPVSLLVAFSIGILMGALDHGIMLPARLPIQQNFGISASAGIWMVTIYTLVTAVSMPLVSKLADRYGRRQIFLACIFVFALGSVLAGLSNSYSPFNRYPLLLLFRAIQAAGAGALVPIASAEISASFPANRKGYALGMIGGMYGVASILGPTIGSYVLAYCGVDRWGWLFFLNIPLAILVIILGRGISQQKSSGKTSFDMAGAVLLALFVASLLYALSNLNFFVFSSSLLSKNVWPFLLAAVALFPVLTWIETRAQDPILNPRYFRNPEILKVFFLSFLVGIRFMFVIFMAQFVENILVLPIGGGGYHITFMALCAGISAPACGKLCDKHGARLVLAAGFIFHVLGFLVLALWVPHSMSLVSLITGLFLVGIGIGFTMGTPLNYLMLNEVNDKDAATGLATLALVRSIGITLSPGLLVGFISEAGGKVFPALSELFPMLNRAEGKDARSAEEIRILFENTNAANIMETIKSLIPPDVLERIGWMVGLATPLVTETYQKALNAGFIRLFFTLAALSAVGVLLTPLLKKPSIKKDI